MMNKQWVYAGLLVAALAGSGAAAAASPDLNGVWQVDGAFQELKTLDGKTPPLNAEATKVYEQNRAKWKARDLSFDPTAKCISPGLPRILYLQYPFEIVQSNKTIAYLFQWNYWNRLIELSDKPQDVPYPLSMGISRAKWKGDTLVIDTIGLRSDNTWLDSAGMPHSDDLHLIEQLRLVDGGRTLESKITIDDPKTFTKTWDTTVRFKKLPAGTEIKEDVCLDRTDAKQAAVVWTKK